ncbi:MAG: group I intron-associated PD-(D/E)XK endonuclease [Candidatus Omnitrophica bacterium]|nr:group I intron-associated PD-(D/E)XK endonuclease [Candidatus Omnitrophota bacterium]
MHHTKEKADLGVAKTIADLVSKGHVPCVPLSEHQPYDLVVVLNEGAIVKLQVKYATLKQNGAIEVKFRTSWADKNGSHTRRYSEKEFDFYAIFCPEKDIVLYIPNSLNCPKTIRFDQTHNNQKKYVRWARDYLVIKGESSETKRHTPEMVKT